MSGEVECIEIIYTYRNRTLSKFKTHSRRPVNEALDHLNEKYVQKERRE